jgi:hypothetical protein
MQMYIDELPIWGFIGKVDKSDSTVTYYLFTHIHWDISYNKNQIISIETRADPETTRDITADGPQDIQFTFSVKWKETVEKVQLVALSTLLTPGSRASCSAPSSHGLHFLITAVSDGGQVTHSFDSWDV